MNADATTTTDDTARQAAMLEAETLQRAGRITLTQGKALIRERQALRKAA